MLRIPEPEIRKALIPKSRPMKGKVKENSLPPRDGDWQFLLSVLLF